MKEFKVKLDSLSQVRDFADAASGQPCDVHIVGQECDIDAKSILGLVALDLSQPLTVRYHGGETEAQGFRQQVASYLLA